MRGLQASHRRAVAGLGGGTLRGGGLRGFARPLAHALQRRGGAASAGPHGHRVVAGLQQDQCTRSVIKPSKDMDDQPYPCSITYQNISSMYAIIAADTR